MLLVSERADENKRQGDNMNATQELTNIIWNSNEKAALSVNGYRIYAMNDKFIILTTTKPGPILYTPTIVVYVGAADTLNDAAGKMIDHMIYNQDDEA